MFNQETPDPGRRGALCNESSTTLERPEAPGVATRAREAADAAPAPKTVGPFAIVERLGTGAMGEVYLARDQRLERWVALKRIQPGRHGRESVARFRREARTAAKLHHRSIVQVHDLLETEESDWLVMERLEGESLADRLLQGPLAPVEALHVAIRIAEGLAAAHAAGVMHRDLKASNIMLTPNGVKILDFGLAKNLPGSDRQDTGVTSEGQLIGTIASMAPEQAKGLVVDERADLFAFGMLLYEMLTGASPFKRRSALATMNAICDEPAPRLDQVVPDLPPVLVELVRQLLEKEPDDRPGGAREVTERLRQARLEIGGSSSSDYAAVVAGRRGRRRRLVIAVAVLVFILALLLLAWLGQRQTKPEPPLRLVVANFEYSGGERHGYFAQGLAEEVRSRLSALESVRVIRPLDREQAEPAEALAALDARVDFVLEGRVSWPPSGSAAHELPGPASSDQRVSVHLHLASSDGTSLWRHSFEEHAGEILRLQARLANAVAARLPIEISESERSSIQLQGTFNQAAYLAYLEGRDWERRSRFASDSIRYALLAYRRALEHDALFVDAHARLVRFETMDYLNRARPPERTLAVLRRLAALEELAPDHPATWLAAAEVAYRVKSDYERALVELERVLEVEPGNAEALATSGYVLRRQGRLDEAIGVFEEVALLTPYDASIPAFIAETLRAQRRFGEAAEQYRASLRLVSTDGWVRGQGALCLLEAQDCRKGQCDLGPALALLDAAPDPDDEAIRLHRFWIATASAPDEDPGALSAALDHLPASFDEQALNLVSFPGQAAVLRALGREQELRRLAGELIDRLEEAIELGDRYPTNHAVLAVAKALSSDPGAIDEAREHAEEAIRLAEPDRFSGPRAVERWAMALALGGRADEAVPLLKSLLARSYQRAVTRQTLRLDPTWAALRRSPEGSRLIHSYRQ